MNQKLILHNMFLNIISLDKLFLKKLLMIKIHNQNQ